jgi:hypothetical protein
MSSGEGGLGGFQLLSLLGLSIIGTLKGLLDGLSSRLLLS